MPENILVLLVQIGKINILWLFLFTFSFVITMLSHPWSFGRLSNTEIMSTSISITFVLSVLLITKIIYLVYTKLFIQVSKKTQNVIPVQEITC